MTGPSPPLGAAGGAAAPPEPALADDLALGRRVGWRLGLMDLEGRLCARPPGSREVLVTPGPASGSPARLDAAGVLSVSLDAPSAGDDAGIGSALELAILRQRPDVSAIATGAPQTAMAFGSVGRDVLPLTHTWATFALEGAAWVEPQALLDGPVAADLAARSVGGAGYVHVPGVAVLALGESPLDALRRLDAFEYLARLTSVASELAPAPRRVSREQADDIPRQRPPEPRPSRDFRRYYRSLDRRPGPTPEERWPATDPLAVVRRDVAVACRILAHSGDLVAFFEHVSHRIPGQPDRFAMTPAKDFAAMEPSDVLVLEMAGDCRQLEGELPAAPFRWYHRDVLEARPDVHAIVHTHELHGRAFVFAEATPEAVHRYAHAGLGSRMPPVFPEVSLLFSPEHRTAMLELLGDGPFVHAFSHGTDFCEADLATATRRAVHREQHLRFLTEARRLGRPSVLDTAVLEGLARASATAQQWWAAHADAALDRR